MKAFNDIIKRAQKDEKKNKSQNKAIKPKKLNNTLKERNIKKT